MRISMTKRPIQSVLRAFALVLLLSIMIAGPAEAQPEYRARADSLRERLQQVEGHERVQVLAGLMRAYYDNDPPQAHALGQEALDILRRRPNDALRAEVLYVLGGAYYFEDKRDSSLAYNQRARDLALAVAAQRRRERTDATELLARAAEAERFMGHVYYDWARYDEAEAAYRRAWDRMEEIGNQVRGAVLANDIAVLHKTRGQYLEALAYHTRALAVLQERGVDREAANVKHGIGVVYNLMGRYAEALNTFREVLEVHDRLGDDEARANTLTNIGGVFELMGDYEQALSHYRNARDIYRALGRKRRMANSYTNIGGALVHLGRYDEAARSYERARSLAEETHHQRLLAYINEGFGRIYEAQNEPERARQAFDAALAGFQGIGERRGIATALISVGRLRRDESSIAMARQAIEIGRDMNSHQILRDGYELLANLYERQGQFASALEAYRQYKASYDSLFNAENRTTLARLEAEYQMKEQEQRIALLEQRRQVQWMWMFGLLSGVALLGVITVLTFNRARLRQRAFEAQEKAHRAESERARLLAETAEAKAHYLQAENERKAQELEAARRMQLSMLPKELPRHPEAELVTYVRTAAEVGGDYYDFDVADDGALTIAIGDATGHGTQAGTMVAAVKSLFSDYAGASDLVTVLERSARALRRMALPNVYMAFGLARLRDGRLELAGAGMPAALVHRAATGDVLSVSLRGMPLGAPMAFPYEVESVRLDPGDTVVLMSDGFPEQRNPGGEEFGYDQVARVVAEIGRMELDGVADYLDRMLSRWRADRPLGDDVTFVILRTRGPVDQKSTVAVASTAGGASGNGHVPAKSPV